MRTNSDQLRDIVQAAADVGEIPYQANLHAFKDFHRDPVDENSGLSNYRIVSKSLPNLIAAMGEIANVARITERSLL